VYNFTSLIKYSSSWLHVSSQLSLLDDYFFTQKYNEFNHCDHAQISITQIKTEPNDFCSVSTPSSGTPELGGGGQEGQMPFLLGGTRGAEVPFEL
jgi:hypothetical protein